MEGIKNKLRNVAERAWKYKVKIFMTMIVLFSGIVTFYDKDTQVNVANVIYI
jgi:hypothetical protein